MGQVNIKWEDDPHSRNANIHNLFKMTAAALDITMAEAIIRAMDEFNITHADAVRKLAYKPPKG